MSKTKNYKRGNLDSAKENTDESDQSLPVLKPKFGNPNSFRTQNVDSKNQTFIRQPLNVVRHKG